jgi:hypothetical protein
MTFDGTRRWFQFRLRTLLLLVTICAVASPFVVPTVGRLHAWWNPPAKPVGLMIMVTPSGGRLENGGFYPEEEEELLGRPERAP